MAGTPATDRSCSACGAAIAEDAAFCDACGSKQQPPAMSGAGVVAAAPVAAFAYTTFWRRAAAYVLDLVISTVIAALMGLAWGFVALVVAFVAQGDGPYTPDEESAQLLAFGLALLAGWGVAFWAYHWVATARGGGIGKRLLGMRIVRESNGAAPGWGAAFLRLLIPAALAMTFTGIGSLLDYAWAIWDPRRQALHDKAAGTLVVDVSRARTPEEDAARRAEAAATPGTSLRPGTGAV